MSPVIGSPTNAWNVEFNNGNTNNNDMTNTNDVPVFAEDGMTATTKGESRCNVERGADIFEPGFSDASFACRREKGTHAAAARLHQHMLNLSRQAGVRVWARSMDVVKFFMSLHKSTLLGLLEPRVRGLEARLAAEGKLPASGFGPWELCRRIVQHDPSRGARPVGSARTVVLVPPHKHLGALGPDRGIPIGNLTSQFFANVYLSPLDHFVQRTLGVRSYVWYVDDFFLLDFERERLEAYEARVRSFLRDRLKLEVRARPLAPASEGVDFVGYIVRPTTCCAAAVSSKPCARS